LQGGSLFCIVLSIQILQQIKVSLRKYVAAGKDFWDWITRPECCPRCGREQAFQRQGYYARWVDELQIWVARFRCRYCALDVSVLPDFAMPYRNRSVARVAEYFGASDTERRQQGGHDTLRRYWRAWRGIWRQVTHQVGLAAHEARSAWQALLRRFQNAAMAQRHLVQRYQQALLRRYRVHTLPK
jgi:hypothetical protein